MCSVYKSWSLSYPDTDKIVAFPCISEGFAREMGPRTEAGRQWRHIYFPPAFAFIRARTKSLISVKPFTLNLTNPCWNISSLL